MKQNKVKNPKQIHIKAESALLFIDETVAFKMAEKRLNQIKENYKQQRKHHRFTVDTDDKLKVTTTPIF